MRDRFAVRKRAVVLVLTIVICLDIALAVYTWNLASAQSAQQQLALLQRNEKLLRADIAYAQQVRKDIPKIQKDCDEYEQSMFAENTGYSSVIADLGSIAAKAGLRLDNSTFRSNDIKGRGLKEIRVDASVSGNYTGVVRFLNGLQQSPHIYAVETLSARPEAQSQGAHGLLRVSLHLKTYFRAA